MKLKIGFRTFTVREQTKKESKEHSGTFMHYPPMITINTKVDAREQASTLLHELIHAAYDSAGMAGETLPEETATGMIEMGLMGIFADNPTLLNVIDRAIRFGVALPLRDDDLPTNGGAIINGGRSDYLTPSGVWAQVLPCAA